MPNKKRLILGNGLLGSEIYKQTGWDILSRSHDGFDISNLHNFHKYNLNTYDEIINCIAFTDSYNNSNLHYTINEHAPLMLLRYCYFFNIKYIHISTEFVYANNEGIPDETICPIPHESLYAKSKFNADTQIFDLYNNCLILRQLHKDPNMEITKVWHPVYTTGDFVDKITELDIKLILSDATGIFNVGTGEKTLSDLFPNIPTIEKPDHVPRDTRMNLTKMKNYLNMVF